MAWGDAPVPKPPSQLPKRDTFVVHHAVLFRDLPLMEIGQFLPLFAE
jgi:hypothetical protein